MLSSSSRPVSQRPFVATAFGERRPLKLQRPSRHTEAFACVCGVRHLRNIASHSSRRPGQSHLHAFRRSVSDGAGEPATTSGRDSNDDDSQDRPNIIRRAAAAAAGILQSTAHWLQARLKPSKLFDRCPISALYRHCTVHDLMHRWVPPPCNPIFFDCLRVVVINRGTEL